MLPRRIAIRSILLSNSLPRRKAGPGWNGVQGIVSGDLAVGTFLIVAQELLCRYG